MVWNMKGDVYESCSCAIVCPCTIGPAQPDQGWCSGFQLTEISTGQSDGLDLNGTRFALALQLPGDFASGVIDKARLYFDEGRTTPEQRDAIGAIYRGEKGGLWAALGPAIGEWLPPKVAPFSVTVGDAEVSGSIPGAGELRLEFVKTPDGKQAKLVNAPVMGAFEVTESDLAMATGSRGTDPELRGWESLGNGGHFAIDWRA